MLQTRRSTLEFQDFFSKQEKKKAVEAVVWKLPCTDMIKINIDDSFFKAAGHGGWGVVARDADGDVSFSAAGKPNHAQDALQTEAEACLKAWSFAQEYGMQRVQIETDAQMLVKAISSAYLNLSPNGSSKSYVDGKVARFDGCEADTWSPLWLRDFMQQLGYSESTIYSLYWLLPGKNLESSSSRVPPMQQEQQQQNVGHELRRSQRRQSSEGEGHIGLDSGSEDSDCDSDWVDSDNEIGADDDDLFNEWVDEKFDDMKKKKIQTGAGQ
ncbi:hypothetical protein D1007_54685 [Hordeum vulgare]|nr:hypothetical protein D1007_54685 [Hordeum vulgare]